MKKARWGLLSTARINARLIPAIRSSQRGELTAVASRDEATAKKYAGEWEIPHFFDSYEAMLESDKVDAVYIGLPNHLHKEWSIKAMQAGKHVLCEKPFALSLPEVDEMIEASLKTGCKLAEAFMYRHHPQTKLVGEWVQSGKLGEISVVRGAFNFMIRKEYDIRKVPEFGGGCLWDVGVYPMSFAQYIMGEAPKAVSGFQYISKDGIDTSFVGQMIYSGDRLVQITCAFRTPIYTMVEIIGSQGRLVVTRPFVNMEVDGRIIFYPPDSEPSGPFTDVPFEKRKLYLDEVEDMNDAILDGKPNYLKLEETRNHVRTILALYKAAQTGSVVKLS